MLISSSLLRIASVRRYSHDGVLMHMVIESSVVPPMRMYMVSDPTERVLLKEYVELGFACSQNTALY